MREVENSGRRKSRLRIVAWSIAALLLLLPLIAMQFTDDVGLGPRQLAPIAAHRALRER